MLGFRGILRSIDWKLQHIHDIVQHMEIQMTQMDNELQQLKDDVAAERTAVDSATTLISGFSARLQAAIQDAQAAGATAEQLQSVTDLHTAVTQQTSDLANAVANSAPSGGGGTTPLPAGTPAPQRSNP